MVIQRAVPGDEAIRAKDWNTIADAIESNQLPKPTGELGKGRGTSTVIVRAEVSARIEKHQLVRIMAAPVSTRDQNDMFQGDVIYVASHDVAWNEDNPDELWDFLDGFALETVESGSVGRFQIKGLCVARYKGDPDTRKPGHYGNYGRAWVTVADDARTFEPHIAGRSKWIGDTFLDFDEGPETTETAGLNATWAIIDLNCRGHFCFHQSVILDDDLAVGASAPGHIESEPNVTLIVYDIGELVPDDAPLQTGQRCLVAIEDQNFTGSGQTVGVLVNAKVDCPTPAGGMMISGAGAPSAGDGQNGWYWIRESTNEIYGPKAGGTWPGSPILSGGGGGGGTTVIDGGGPSSIYGGTTPIDGGTP